MLYSSVIFLCLATFSLAQRPTYAGSSVKGYPELASRFGGFSDTQNTGNNIAGGIANRVGEDGSGSSFTSQRIPTDARGDVALVNRLNQWPRENRPFWLLNSDHIEQHRRGGNQQAGFPVQGQVNAGGLSTTRSLIQGGGATDFGGSASAESRE